MGMSNLFLGALADDAARQRTPKARSPNTLLDILIAVSLLAWVLFALVEWLLLPTPARAGTTALVPTCSTNCLVVPSTVLADPPSFELYVRVLAPTFEEALAQAQKTVEQMKECGSFSYTFNALTTWVTCKIPKQAPLTDAELARLRDLLNRTK